MVYLQCCMPQFRQVSTYFLGPPSCMRPDRAVAPLECEQSRGLRTKQTRRAAGARFPCMPSIILLFFRRPLRVKGCQVRLCVGVKFQASVGLGVLAVISSFSMFMLLAQCSCAVNSVSLRAVNLLQRFLHVFKMTTRLRTNERTTVFL